MRQKGKEAFWVYPRIFLKTCAFLCFQERLTPYFGKNITVVKNLTNFC